MMIYFLSALLRPDVIEIILCILCAAVGGYFAFRYYALRRALRELNRDLREIQADISQNRILRLPLPARELEQFTESVNDTLEIIRQERRTYAEREREFQKQIENISHDLRTPLTVILGYLKWMKKEKASPEAFSNQAEFLDIIEGNAHAMERLVSQFYIYSRLNGQDYELKLEEIDVRRILTESLVNNYSILEKASIRPDSQLPEHPVTVLGTRDALERIFANLFQNAGRYAHSYLRIRMEEDGDTLVRICFQNDSQKISAEDIPHLFERFYRNDPARGQNSSGLGLTVAKSLAERMGGKLEVNAIQKVPKTRGGLETKKVADTPETADTQRAADTKRVADTQEAADTKKADDNGLTVCFILTLPKAI